MEYFRILDLVGDIASHNHNLPVMISTENRFDDSVELCKTYKHVFQELSMTRLLVKLNEDKIKVTQLEQKAIDKILNIFKSAYSWNWGNKVYNSLTTTPANIDSFTGVLKRDTLSHLKGLSVVDIGTFSSVNSDREIELVLTIYGIDTLLSILKMYLTLNSKIYSRRK